MDNNEDTIDTIESYVNELDLNDKFPNFIDKKIDIKSDKIKYLKKLRKDILLIRNEHIKTYEYITNSGYLKKYNASIEIIDSRISKYTDNKLLKFISKFWWVFIIPLIVCIIGGIIVLKLYNA